MKRAFSRVAPPSAKDDSALSRDARKSQIERSRSRAMAIGGARFVRAASGSNGREPRRGTACFWQSRLALVAEKGHEQATTEPEDQAEGVHDRLPVGDRNTVGAPVRLGFASRHRAAIGPSPARARGGHRLEPPREEQGHRAAAGAHVEGVAAGTEHGRKGVEHAVGIVAPREGPRIARDRAVGPDVRSRNAASAAPHACTRRAILPAMARRRTRV